MSIKISIVTISYNEAKNIARTIESVLGQMYKNIEYVVMDGGSSDGTAEIATRYELRATNEGKKFHFESERDGGIYFGMNKGLAKCTGDYVLFCNAGDRLAAADVIEKVAAAAERDQLPDMVFGDCVDVLDGKELVRVAHGPQFLPFGMPASHEAMFYKLSKVRELGLKYDTSYRIAADYKFTYEFIKAAKTFTRVKLPIVVFAEGGVSTANKWQGLAEACRVRREVSGLSICRRAYIRAAQTAALLLATYAKPIYRAIRLRKNRG